MTEAEIIEVMADGMARTDHAGADVWLKLTNQTRRSYIFDAENAYAALRAHGLEVVKVNKVERVPFKVEF